MIVNGGDDGDVSRLPSPPFGICGCSWSLLPPGCLFDTIVAQPATPGKFSVCPCGVMGDALKGPGPSQEGSVFFYATRKGVRLRNVDPNTLPIVVFPIFPLHICAIL